MASESINQRTLLGEVDVVIVGTGPVGLMMPEGQWVQAGPEMAALTVALSLPHPNFRSIVA